ncbi:ABC transporter permease [Halorarius halobius]|uniref:ABC transporter permease n=1 Tax=Halorarius halobius TaxID=2962671 RepID=UPI0020CEA716|nr:ABC transporter permease [Halorarius halobius]
MSEDSRVGGLLRNYEVPLLVGPAALWFLLFLIVPLGIIFVYSFLTYSSFSVVWEFTLSAWTETLTSPVFADVAVRTVLFATATTLLTLLFGYPVAYYLRFYVSQNKGLLLLLFLVIPFWTSAVIRTTGWFPILTQTGAINYFLSGLGLIDEPLRWLMFSPVSQLLAYLQNYIVFMFAPIYVVMYDVDEELLGASATLRASRWETFRHVVVPLSMPGVVIGAIFVFVLSFGNFVIPQLLSGGSATLPMFIFQNITTGLNYPAAAVLSIIMLAFELFVVYLLTRVVDISAIAER